MKILSLSGFSPDAICDTIRFTGYSGERNITHYCGYANDFLNQVQHDDSIDGAIFPKSCDSTRTLKNYLEDCEKFIFQFNVPVRDDKIGIDFLAEELKSLKGELEEYYKCYIDDIPDRIHKLNKRNKLIGNLYKNIADYSYVDYLKVVHEFMLSPLLREYSIPELGKKHNGKKVYLVGSTLCNTGIVAKLEKYGLCIVGDNLPESGRVAGLQIEEGSEDSFKAIATYMLKQRKSPTQDKFSDILNTDINDIKERKAEAVIFITQKYCEPYDYLYSIYKKELEKNNIPALHIQLTDSEDDRKVDLLVEAFADSL